MNSYEKFKLETGLTISRSTYERMKKEFKSGNPTRMVNIVEGHIHRVERKNRNIAKQHIDELPFKAFDGEGRNLETGHKYVLLANSDDDFIYNPEGLSTVECLDFLLHSTADKSIRIFFSFGYDIQQIVTDLSNDQLYKLMHGQPVRYRNYKLQYLANKIFSVNNTRFYDVFNYWQTSFLNAIASTLGRDAISENLVKGKESRGDFANWDIEDILTYTKEELKLLVELAEHLRTILLRCDIHLGSSFYGPGSIANYWLKHYRINPPKISDPILVNVMERAYYGGRFESFELGNIESVFECDINSAYPSVIATLPYLDDWRLQSNTAYSKSTVFSVWHCRWNISNTNRIGPFPSRDKHGLISYPANGIGWYWKPEIESALAIYGKDAITVMEGYVPETITGRPFGFVQDIYQNRLELKSKGDPAEWGLKVGLNSIYGKTAQRIGSAKYFSLAWAGYITSATRSKLLNIVKERENNVIAFATDAVYFNSDPRITDSKNLGGWGVKHWNRGYFIQSGVYRLETDKCLICGNRVHKELDHKFINHKDAYRGFSVKNGIHDILEQIKRSPYSPPAVYQIKFIGHLEAIRCPNTLGKHRLGFITVRKRLQPFRTTKRKVNEPKVWKILEADTSWIDDTFGKEFLKEHGDNFVYKNKEVFVWNDYSPLLTSHIQTNLLENHNDHSDSIVVNIGELEESYPFARINERQDEIAFHSVDEVAVERIGGASGLIKLSQVDGLPIVDEEEILRELSNG